MMVIAFLEARFFDEPIHVELDIAPTRSYLSSAGMHELPLYFLRSIKGLNMLLAGQLRHFLTFLSDDTPVCIAGAAGPVAAWGLGICTHVLSEAEMKFCDPDKVKPDGAVECFLIATRNDLVADTAASKKSCER